MTHSPDSRDGKQSAYQILVASSADLLARDKGDAWDSGQLLPDESVHVAFAGKPLASAQELSWEERVGDGAGKRSACGANRRVG